MCVWSGVCTYHTHTHTYSQVVRMHAAHTHTNTHTCHVRVCIPTSSEPCVRCLLPTQVFVNRQLWPEGAVLPKPLRVSVGPHADPDTWWSILRLQAAGALGLAWSSGVPRVPAGQGGQHRCTCTPLQG